MRKKKMALIGSSAVGKSTCCKQLEQVAGASSMDKQFGKNCTTLVEAIDWIENGTVELVVDVSAHENLFAQIFHARRSCSGQLNNILFVHLYCSVPGIRLERLRQSGRQDVEIQCALAWDELVNDLCKNIADISINTADISIDDVIRSILAIQKAWLN